MEIIIVNNNSTDRSRKICEDYRKQFPKIALVDNPEKGTMPTRLAGMALAKGDWLLHLDADDKFALDMIEKMVAVAEYNNADITICDFFKWTQPNKITVKKYNYNGLFDKKKIKAEIAPNFIPGSTQKPIYPCAWTKLFRTSLLRGNFRYYDKNVRMGEDILLSYPNILFADRVYFLNEPLPYHRQSNIQITGRYKPDYLNDITNIYNNLKNLNDDYGEYDFSIQLCNWYVLMAFDVVRNEKKSEKDGIEDIINKLIKSPVAQEACDKYDAFANRGYVQSAFANALKDGDVNKIYRLAFPSKISYPYRKLRGLLGKNKIKEIYDP